MGLRLKNSIYVSRANSDSISFTKFILDNKPATFLDMGTGSGYIALKLHQNGAKVQACDISAEAVQIAKDNLKLYNADIMVFQSDLFENINNSFDAIAFNIPFSFGQDKLLITVLKSIIREIKFLDLPLQQKEDYYMIHIIKT